MLMPWLLLTSSASAATLPTGFTETQVAAGLNSPTAMAFAPDGRLFVCLQGGQLRVIKNGALLSTPFLTVTVNSSGERGLLGVAFDPNFASNHYVYVYYTATSPALHNRVSRFTANGDVAVPGSETVLLDLNNLSSATNHNGGAIHFGIDNKLYIAVGDNANSANSQSLGTLLGKMLRINPDGSIPTDNPYYGSTSGVNRAIWGMGLRNPFTFNVEPFSGRLFINDVGQDTWEEINDGVIGSNYGWPNTEGATSNGNYRSPLHSYRHGSGTTQGCAITGGTFYNPPQAHFPAAYSGDFFFADYCSGWINRLDPSSGNTVTNFAQGITAPVDLQVSADGRLYYLARGSSAGAGGVYRIQYAGGQAPSITQHPASQTKAVGQPVTFTVAASGDAPLSYQWQRNDIAIPNATSASYTINSTSGSDNGDTFRCVVTNSAGSATSNEATLTLTNPSVVATITQPAQGSLYSGGDVITYAGTATEGGTALPASAYTWQVDFHHDTHHHPFMAATSGATSGSFTIPRTGETSSNVWYRIYLTVTDSQGLSTTTSRDITPRKVNVTIATAPLSSLQITLDGQPQTAPLTFTGVVGVTRTIGTSSPQTSGGSSYTFSSWSDGGAITHDITTPSTNQTFTATFTQSVATTQRTDITSQGTAIALITNPLGGGNHSLSVIRDGVYPAVGSTNSAQQYDTYTGDTGRTTDWIGYSFPSAHTFASVDFQEGRQFGDGGWFTSLTVQVRVNGTWTTVSGFSSSPAYPGANGVTYERFTLNFTAKSGDAIRISGTPGGSARFVSVGELRVWADEPTSGPPPPPPPPPPPSQSSDITTQGTPIALITNPLGGGNHSLAVIRDGVYPAVGSTSSAQQYDTYTGDTSRTLDWIGYSFTANHTFTSLDFQEGRQFGDGGWFTTLKVQVRVNGVWTDVSGFSSTPSYPGANGTTYERFSLTFTPISGDAIRIAGTPGGSARFISVGELRAWASN
jgi:glucose/arabinose dehydrogenase